jgi:hypothetical protein
MLQSNRSHVNISLTILFRVRTIIPGSFFMPFQGSLCRRDERGKNPVNEGHGLTGWAQRQEAGVSARTCGTTTPGARLHFPKSRIGTAEIGMSRAERPVQAISG